MGDPMGDPSGGTETFVAPDSLVAPGGTTGDGFMAPVQPGQPYGYDPFVAGQPRGGPYGGFPGAAHGVGPNGPQPYRYGWTSRYEYAYLSSTSLNSALGDLEWNEFNAEWEYTSPSPWGKIYSVTPQFGLRSGDLPGGDSWFRFGLDLEAVTPTQGPWSFLLAFNPSINSDLDRNLSTEAWQFDSHGMIFYQSNPYLTWVAGAGFWDRVEDRVIPYAGFIFVPDDHWELRLVLPEPRISHFLGVPWGLATWAYVRAEYHVESYEANLEGAYGKRQVQIEDGRLMGGFRFDSGCCAAFVEAGWVFEREFQVRDFHEIDLSDAFMARAGVRY